MTAQTSAGLNQTEVLTRQPDSFQNSPFYRVLTKPPVMGLFFCVFICVFLLLWYILHKMCGKKRVIADSCRDPRRPAYEMMGDRWGQRRINP
ncbi:ORF28 [macacine gammaherpesvirus 12]|uniref:ORF28 n=1 Tax=macacine gammaherpesvirus 12 TaxID=2560571 RepID=A0A0B5CYD9_9GAMA|nr:ORF28 [Macaca nemestrina rhadinovirus 2]AJE29669.1 ORF28 [Macaca nemestrina rhadinovirus 2]